MAQQMKIKVVAVEVGNGKTKTNKDYKFLEVTYKNLSFDGKVESKKIMPFGSKEVFKELENAQSGDVFTLLREKDNDGYWQWVGISAGDVEIEQSASAAPPAATAAPKAGGAAPAKSTFETPEERAKKQIYIVRQSSLATAVDLLKTDKKVPSVDEVIAVAQQFSDYVFGADKKVAVDNPVKAPDLDPDEDIPM